MYEIIKDFASPLVTLIAAVTAGLITITFARTQTRIAESQRDIALDKLKFDLFEKRYEVYLAITHLIHVIFSTQNTDTLDEDNATVLMGKISEAKFYFSPDLCKYLDQITKPCLEFMSTLKLLRRTDPNDHKTMANLSTELDSQRYYLLGIYGTLTEAFEPELAFRQLLRPLD